MTYKDKKLDIEPFEAFYNLLGIDAKKTTIEPSETQQKRIKKAPEGANFKNGGNNVVNLELYLDRIKVQLSEQSSQKVIFMLKFLQERKVVNY